jgi:hypothetical protein
MTSGAALAGRQREHAREARAVARGERDLLERQPGRRRGGRARARIEEQASCATHSSAMPR